MTVRYFYDFEFLEDGKTIEPISIGVVADHDDGSEPREYYAVFEEISWQPEHRLERVFIGVGEERVAQPQLYRRICAHDWLMANVVPHLPLKAASAHYQPVRPRDPNSHHSQGAFDLNFDSPSIKPRRLIRAELLAFLLEPVILREPIELWGYYAAYDHVLLAQVLGGPMSRLPSGIPMWTNDLIQEEQRLDMPLGHRPAKSTEEHHALADARWNLALWRALLDYADVYRPVPRDQIDFDNG